MKVLVLFDVASPAAPDETFSPESLKQQDKPTEADVLASLNRLGHEVETLAVFDDVPSTALPASDVSGDGIGIVDLVLRVGLAPSKSEARRLVQSGGVYVNNRRVSDLQLRLTREHAIGGRLFVLRKGQKQNHLVRLT